MLPMKWIGAGAVCAASLWTGLSASRRMKSIHAQLRRMIAALEQMDCELGSEQSSFRRLCGRLQDVGGPVGAYFARLWELPYSADESMEQIERSAAQRAGLCLPPESAASVHRLIVSFGRYDLAGQRQLLGAALRQLRSDETALQQTLAGKCRCYEMLGLCTGAAFAILVI